MARDKLQPVPSDVTGAIGELLNNWWKVLNSEPHISRFSGVSPNTSAISGQPGELIVNIGSASTSTRLWQMSGGGSSVKTTGWVPVRIA